MTREEAINLVKKYAKLHRKDKNYYAFNYGLPHTIDDKGKKQYVKKPWFVDQTIKDETYYNHLRKEKYRSWGLILPPTNEKNEAGLGAVDKDVYNNPEDLKRIIKQIYDEKLPLVPCYSKSKGLHIYLYCKDDVPAEKIRSTLKHYNKYLKINAKEVNPKQTKLKWNKKKKRFDPGNGILIPYMDCLEQKGTGISHVECLNQWIKNADLETGNLEEFLDYAESVSVDKDFFGEQPLELEEKKEEEKKPNIETEERDFSELDARPLSGKSPLLKIIQNIKNKKEHERGGAFDNHVIDFVYGAMQSKISDKHIHEYLNPVWQYADKTGDQYQGRDQKDYFDFKINNCRDKYDKEDPAPLREKFMHNIIFIKKAKKYFDNSTKGSYDKEAIEITYAHIFPKKTTPTAYFKEHPKKQLAEEETYRPDLYNEKDPLMKGADNLYYINNYKPGKIKPIKPEKIKDIEPFLNLMEHLATIEKERNHVLNILAYIIQKPWKKVKTITVFYTKHQRFGKGTLFDTLVDILGETNAEPTDVKGILDKGVTFAEKQLVLVDEVKSVGDFGERANFINDLKKIGTETRIQQRRLYVDYKIIETQTNYLIFTNNPDALNIEAEDERLFVIANENERKPISYYKAYHKWRQDKGSSYVYWYLLNRDISKFNPMEPPPMTEGKKAMGKETGHPLTLKLREMLEEGQHPLRLNVSVIGSTELAEYIGKHHKGKHVQYANDTKLMKRSLLGIGAIELGQIYHKSLDYKPSLFVIRNQEEMMRKPKTELCNGVWKPIIVSQPAEEKREEDSTERFNNKDHSETNREFEKRFQTGCWSCHKKLDTDSDDKCIECNFGIKCDCGKCACDDPRSKVKKLPEFR